MFTGIIEEIGQIKHIAFGTKSSRLIISADKVLDEELFPWIVAKKSK